MMRKTFYFWCLTLLAFQLAAQKKAPDSNKVLSSVVITYAADEATPITFQNIDGAELQLKSVGQEPSFLLAETPSMTQYSDAGHSNGYSYFRLRGIDQTRINISLDGVPLNEPEDQGAYFSNYADILNSVRKVQIQRGVGTSKNGVASFAGSVQLFTPGLYEPRKTTVGASYGSFNSLRTFGEFNSGVKNNKAFYARVSEVYTDGYKHHSSNHSQSAFLSGGYFTEKSKWKANVLMGYQQNELAWLGVSDSLIKADPRTNGNAQENDQFFQGLAQVLNYRTLSPKTQLQSSVYYTFVQGDYDFDLNNFLGLPSTSEMYNYAFTSHLMGFFSNVSHSWKNTKLITGIHGNLYNREHLGSEASLGQLYVNTGFKNEMSAFAKLEHTHKRFHFLVDLQFRHTHFEYEGGVALNRYNWNFINPKAGISYNASKGLQFYYGVGRTGREPTRNDIFGGNDDLLADSIGNALTFIDAAEYVVDHELGFRYTSKKWRLNANLFHMSFDNEILLNGQFGPNGLALTTGVEQSTRSGLELDVWYKVSRWLVLTNRSSYNYSRIEESGETFSPILTPRIIVHQEVVCSRKALSGAIGIRFQDKSFMDFANENTLDAYTLLNSRVSYQAKKLRLSLFLNNLTNVKYFNNGYVDFDGTNKYFIQAPTNYSFSATYSF